MVKRFKKTIAVLLALVVMVVNAMTITVNATETSINSLQLANEWRVYVDPFYPDLVTAGYVEGLVKGKDIGITFHCETFNNGGFSEFLAWGQILQQKLRKGTDNGAKLNYAGKVSTDLFCHDWYELNEYGDIVAFTISPKNYTYGANQYLTGYSE